MNNLELFYYKKPEDFTLEHLNLSKYKNLEEILIETVNVESTLAELGRQLSDKNEFKNLKKLTMKDQTQLIKNFSIEQLKRVNSMAYDLGVARSLIQFKDECILVSEYDEAKNGDAPDTKFMSSNNTPGY